jgi:hypothetical protein
MVAHAVCTDSISVLRKIRAVLMTAFLATLCAGCARTPQPQQPQCLQSG